LELYTLIGSYRRHSNVEALGVNLTQKGLNLLLWSLRKFLPYVGLLGVIRKFHTWTFTSLPSVDLPSLSIADKRSLLGIVLRGISIMAFPFFKKELGTAFLRFLPNFWRLIPINPEKMILWGY